MRRTEARELFMQLLFQMEVQKDYGSDIKERFVQEHMKDSAQIQYFNSLYDAVTTNLSVIDRIIEDCSENWKLFRMAKVDLAVLRLSSAEILNTKNQILTLHFCFLQPCPVFR